MSKKSILLSVMMACLATFAVATGSMAKDTGPEVITMQTEQAKKPAVFPHRKHQEMMECTTCHHTKDAEGKQIPLPEDQHPAKCDSCHNKDFANKSLDGLMKVGHARCKGCHKDGLDGKKGPTKCEGCHPKK